MPMRPPATDRPSATPPRVLACVAAVFACAGGASAQFALGAQPTRVDQGYADIDALSTSLRAVDMPTLLRQPVGFQDLFAGSDGMLYRFDGGLGASFPYSEYIQTKDGEQVLVPAGTVFHIGMRPEDLVAAPTQPRHSASRASARAPLGLSDAAPIGIAAAQRGRGAPVVRSSIVDETARHIVTDERYRRDRIAELLRESAADDAAMGRKR